MKYDVRNRLTGETQFTAEIDCAENATSSIKLGLAVLWAIENGADLSNADLGGLIISQGPVRGDGYQYILFTSALGGCVIRAGCRTWTGEDAIAQAREHCETVTALKYRAQALRIVDYLEGELLAVRALSAFSDGSAA